MDKVSFIQKYFFKHISVFKTRSNRKTGLIVDEIPESESTVFAFNHPTTIIDATHVHNDM